jgi:hypothetical protein
MQQIAHAQAIAGKARIKILFENWPLICACVFFIDGY